MILSKRRKSGHKDWPLPILLLLAAGLIAAVVSCSGGVSEEEFDAVVVDLEIEKTKLQVLASESATAKAETSRLVEVVDSSEVSIAELESELAKERAALAGGQARIDEAEAEAALLATFLAWNRKDREEFVARFSDNGISDTLLLVPAGLGEPPLALRRVMDVAVTDDTATIHAMFALGTQRHSIRYSMAKQDGVWKIDGEERLSPKIKGDPTVVDIRLDGCASLSASEAVVEGSVALIVENASEGRQQLILKKVPEDLDLEGFLQGNTAAFEGVLDVAFIAETVAGQSINIAFTEPLQPGLYALLCYRQDSGGMQEDRPAAEGIVATFTVK